MGVSEAKHKKETMSMSTDDRIFAAKTIRRALKPGNLLVLLLAAGVLCGCARRYDITLPNGQQLTNVRKPKLNKAGGYYYYVDGRGRTNLISAARVVEIDPHQKATFTSPK